MVFILFLVYFIIEQGERRGLLDTRGWEITSLIPGRPCNKNCVWIVCEVKNLLAKMDRLK